MMPLPILFGHNISDQTIDEQTANFSFLYPSKIVILQIVGNFWSILWQEPYDSNMKSKLVKVVIFVYIMNRDPYVNSYPL